MKEIRELDEKLAEIEKLMREKYTFPVIMLTAKVDDMDKITGLTRGAVSYTHLDVYKRQVLC